MNGDNELLKRILGPLADKVELRRGDTVVTCDPEVKEQATVSRDVFEAMIAGGYTAFQVNETTGVAEKPIKAGEYDPVIYPRVIMLGQRAGG